MNKSRARTIAERAEQIKERTEQLKSKWLRSDKS